MSLTQRRDSEESEVLSDNTNTQIKQIDYQAANSNATFNSSSMVVDQPNILKQQSTQIIEKYPDNETEIHMLKSGSYIFSQMNDHQDKENMGAQFNNTTKQYLMSDLGDNSDQGTSFTMVKRCDTFTKNSSNNTSGLMLQKMMLRKSSNHSLRQ